MPQITDEASLLMSAILSMDAFERDPEYTPSVIYNALLAGRQLGEATELNDFYDDTGSTFGATTWDVTVTVH